MGLLGRIGHIIKREVEEAVERKLCSIEDRLKGKLDEWEQGLYKKVTKMNKHVNGKLITDFNEFKTEWEKNAGDPIQSVFFLAMASYNYVLLDKKVGENMATIILAKTFLLKNSSSPTGFKVNPKGDGYLLEHMRETPRIVKSYFGGTPENDYEVDTENLDMLVVGKYEGKTDRGIPEACITIDSGGKDFDTPLFLRRNDQGQWKMFGFSSFATGVQETKKELGDF
ncbi:MAG TPA: hypothetical protein VMV49_02865 [Candidatus Deferrimicrobium sp.]|nr:hypothetical protein [Candidatus Deferrimicrobium sp.]